MCLNMIDGYRTRGHLFTKTNPVRERRQYFPGKELETFGLSDADMDTVFNAGVEIGLGPAKLRDIRQTAGRYLLPVHRCRIPLYPQPYKNKMV